MASVLRFSAVAALVSTAAGAALGAMPSQTMGGFGEPIFAVPLPTEPPSLELVKRKLVKKDLTNICTEWTIPGGFGQPECGNSETCLFTSANGYYYEGCGETSIAYNWVTECWNYPQYGDPPISQIYCPESAPYCGYFAFVVGVDYTFWNFGCSTSAYKLFVDLLPSTTEGGSSPVVLAGGGTSQITPIATTVYVTQQPSSAGGTATVLVAPGATQNGAQISSTTLPTTTKTSTPIGAIVGGILGGIALIAFLSFLLWFYVRKRRKDKAFALAAAQNQQQQADAAAAAAFHNQSRITEIGGTPKPAGAYIQPPSPRTGVFPEKPPDGNQSAHVVNANLGSQSPPPRYPQSPQSNPLIPNPSNYSELEEQRRAGGRTPTSPFSWQTGQRSEQEVSELGGTNRGSWNVLEGVQEMSASTGDINRRPVGGARAEQGQYVDMSGAPMSEAFHSHELE